MLAAVPAGWAGTAWWRGKNVSPVQRGWQVADAHGCFACHGPGGAGREGVPSFGKDDLEVYAKSDDEIREWILDGKSRRALEEAQPEEGADRPLFTMPAFRGVIGEAEVGYLVAYVRAVGDLEVPADERAEAGRQAAERLGCFGCHGPQGRGSLANPRSFKGYIPPWDGSEFAELAASDAEIAEWILDGRPRRLQGDRMARYFLDRQVIQMPAYRGRVETQEVDDIVRYVRWLRRDISR